MCEEIQVLHVEDQVDFAEVTATFLRRENERFSVLTAPGPEEGLNRLDETDVDCIVSDYDMPARTGIGFLETVRESYESLPFILFTGKGSEQVASEAISAGATDYLQKEGDSSQYTVLANRIENAVEQHRARRQSERANRRRRQTLRRITDGYTEFDSDLTFTDINEQTAEFLGLPREEVLGRNYRDLTEPGTSEIVTAYEAVLETGEPRTVESVSDVHSDHWVEERIFPAENSDGLFIYFQDVTDRKRHEMLQNSIIDISSTLITTDADEIDERIRSTLSDIGAFEGADRCYVFQVYDDGRLMDNTHEWCAPGVRSHKPQLQGMETANFEWFMPRMRAGETVTVPSVDTLSPDAAFLRETLESGDIESIVTIPLSHMGSFLGFIGFDWLEQQAPWSDETIDLLEVSGNIIASALVREQNERE